jgi:hypothetical protein
MATGRIKRKPKTRRTTMKTLADYGNRTLPPEREMREYEFASGTKPKKAGKGAYTNN